jgi:menaquinone-dependent protoporphyrinogen oxidase
MRKILVGYSTKRGATAEIAEAIGTTLRARGFDVDVQDVRTTADVRAYHAVIVGSAIYMGRWLRPAVRFLHHNRRDLRLRPVWLFQDGPLGDDRKDVEQPLPAKVSTLARRIGAFNVVTFGGRLASDAKGLVAKRVAKRYAGDFRDFGVVEAWASHIAEALTPRAA